MLKFADSHLHLDAPAFDADRAHVLATAEAAGVRLFILPATCADSWATIRDLSASYPTIRPAYGLHPLFLARHRDTDLGALERWLQRYPACAVGEIGLDYHLAGLSRERQRDVFIAQLKLAYACDLPVILHARRALDEVTQLLRRHTGLRGVVHSFAGSPQQAAELWKLGFHLGIGGPVTYPRAQKLRRIVAAMPLEYLLLETDAPDQPLCGHQGQRNEPAYLAEVLASVAQLRDQSPAAIAAVTLANTVRLFPLRLPPAAALTRNG